MKNFRYAMGHRKAFASSSHSGHSRMLTTPFFDRMIYHIFSCSLRNQIVIDPGGHLLMTFNTKDEYRKKTSSLPLNFFR
jgi:hypothetical protein